jgi:outer membrane protein TolC
MTIRQHRAVVVVGTCMFAFFVASPATSEEVVWKASHPKPGIKPAAHHDPERESATSLKERGQAPANEPAKTKDMPGPAQLPPPQPAVTSNKLPIDLETAFRLANAQNPAIAAAWARVREAVAHQDQADVLWLPNLAVGGAYIRHDGQTQNQRGEVFGVSRSSAFGGGGAQLRVDTAEAIFQPLVARRLVLAESANARATMMFTQLDVALAYIELVQSYGLLAVNADTLTRAEKVFELAKTADKSGISKSAGDINRSRTEVALRRQERIDHEARASVASARLARLLLLEQSVELYPADPVVVPVALVHDDVSLYDLIGLALLHRPDLAANRAAALAAWERVRQARYGPLVPRLQIDYLGGTFGGGRNDFIGDFKARGDLAAQAYWELRNFGFGNAAQLRERRAQQDQATLRIVDLQARIGAEVTEAMKVAAARQRSLEEAQQGVREAGELYRKLLAIQFSPLGDARRYDPLELQLAVQSLNQARVMYLNQVVDFNRAQFRLFAALGSPPECAASEAKAQPLQIPVIPDKIDEKKNVPFKLK